MKNNIQRGELETLLKKYEKEIKKSNCDDDIKIYYFICKYFLNDGIDINDEDFELNYKISKEYFDIAWNDTNNKEIIFIKFDTRENINDRYYEIVNDIRKQIPKYIEEFDVENDEKYDIRYILINISQEGIKNTESIIKNLNDLIDNKENDKFEIINFKKFLDHVALNIKHDLFVKEWCFDIDKTNNYLLYDLHDKYRAYVCNVSAKSLKELYKEYGNSILNLNLRFFKKKNEVDDKIKKSIQNGKEFWLLNNGIYIVCDNVEFKDNRLILNKFSIINGGQTTFNIANSIFDNDFYLLAKIVVIENWGDEKEQKEAYEFANEVALASNRQKPINNKDLISNFPSINELKHAFLQFRDFKDNEGIFLETKKGEWSFSKDDEIIKQIYKTSKTPEYFMQLWYCWTDFKPGKAKSPASLYKDLNQVEKIMSDIKNNLKLFTNLAWIDSCFKKINSKKGGYVEKISKDKHLANIFKYYNFYNITLIKVMIWLVKYKDDYNKLRDLNDMDELKELFKSYEIDLVLNDDINKNEFCKIIFDIFKERSQDIVEKSLIKKYNEASWGQEHNVVKSDIGFLGYAQEFAKNIRNHTDHMDLIKKLFKI